LYLGTSSHLGGINIQNPDSFRLPVEYNLDRIAVCYISAEVEARGSGGLVNPCRKNIMRIPTNEERKRDDGDDYW
jgi:hypothetical protein